ncbi:MAG: hypothetical protein JWN15_3491 [Firmicutes bacterium]|nr:hypothetical protein [Bacillota bacterium]
MKFILDPSPLATTRVMIVVATPELLIVRYSTVGANEPKTYGNFVQTWQDTTVGWSNPSGGWKSAIASDRIQGDVPLALPLQAKDYVCGYSVGGSVNNICATAVIHGGDPAKQEQFATRISVQPAADTVLVQYTTPEGCQPSAFGHWVALFDDGGDPYTAPPLTLSPVTGNARVGSVPLFYSMLAGRSYLVAYFAGGAGADQSGVACTFRFAVAP